MSIIRTTTEAIEEFERRQMQMHRVLLDPVERRDAYRTEFAEHSVSITIDGSVKSAINPAASGPGDASDVQTTPPNLRSRQSLLSGSMKFHNVQYRPASVNRCHPSYIGLNLPQDPAKTCQNLLTSPSKHHTLQATTRGGQAKAPQTAGGRLYSKKQPCAKTPSSTVAGLVKHPQG
ncbi:hypothetical protein BU25DRAFT_447564 [Macroventuria anomochaeta]|uniref:Uncharacterized protein n=1 Tax=Macroventuria anomochaeta TaxID=301207 RepID=A0ACB6S6U4_9PLEO|nr:uncharacterized protein BU25DRAFT_447564 [Macroventuria anomochaeta]KAF2629084.1 hypothetical protein BU25DRAFT_447564 [Macroventuria anomochaeta]